MLGCGSMLPGVRVVSYIKLLLNLLSGSVACWCSEMCWHWRISSKRWYGFIVYFCSPLSIAWKKDVDMLFYLFAYLLSSFKFSMNWFLCSTIGAVERILNAKAVNHAYPMAPAYGLYLGGVKYDLPWYSGRGLQFIWILAMTGQEESSHFYSMHHCLKRVVFPFDITITLWLPYDRRNKNNSSFIWRGN